MPDEKLHKEIGFIPDRLSMQKFPKFHVDDASGVFCDLVLGLFGISIERNAARRGYEIITDSKETLKIIEDYFNAA